MKSYVAALCVAAVVVAALTPLVARVARRLGAVSGPGGRHIHEMATPRLGGVAIAIACCVPLVGAFVVDSGVSRIVERSWQQPVAILLGGLVLCAVGALDDVRGVRAGTKLTFQILAASVAFALGLRIEAIDLPYLGVQQMGVFALPVTLLWIVGVTNAVNLIDGLDGLAAGIVFFASLTNFVVALVAGSVLVALVMACVMGAMIGFLLYNFNPAKIFMGDSGSYFLGYVLATASLAGNLAKASTTVSLLVPLIALGVPVFDTLFSILRRFAQRRSIFSADREHIHHRLIDLGLTHKRAVLTLYAASIVFMVAAIVLALGRDWSVGLAILAATVVMLGLVRFGKYFDAIRLGKAQGASRVYDAHTERLRAAFLEVSSIWNVSDNESLFQTLAALGEKAGWNSIVLVRGGEPVWEWHAIGETTHVRNQTSSSFGFGDGWKLTFLLDGDLAQLSPQVEILLQVVTDVAAHTLCADGAHSRAMQRRGGRSGLSEALPAAVGSVQRTP